MNTKRITTEITDAAGDFRVTQKATNGNITHASTEGYKNKADLRKNEIDSSIAILDFYSEDITSNQRNDIAILLGKLIKRFVEDNPE